MGAPAIVFKSFGEAWIGFHHQVRKRHAMKSQQWQIPKQFVPTVPTLVKLKQQDGWEMPPLSLASALPFTAFYGSADISGADSGKLTPRLA